MFATADSYYHVVDEWFGWMGSNNTFLYTNYPNMTAGPPHSFSLLMGSTEEAPPNMRSSWSVQDSALLLGLAMIFYTIRHRLYQPLMSLLTQRFRINQDLIIKKDRSFAKNAWLTTFYVLNTLFGMCVLVGSSWLYDTNEISANRLNHTSDELPFMRLYLLFGAAFYLQDFYSMWADERDSKDLLEMTIHHIATISLIICGMVGHYHRLGTLVLFLHDISDIFLYGAKTFKYLGQETVCDMLFVCFAVSFFFLRLIVFPRLVFASCINNPSGWDYPSRYFLFRYVDGSGGLFELSEYGACSLNYCISIYWFMTGFMVLLFCMHVFWFTLICKIVYAIKVKGVELKDPNEVEEDEEEKRILEACALNQSIQLKDD